VSAGTDLERGALDDLAERWRTAWVGKGSFADCCTGDVSYEDPLTRVPLVGPGKVTEHAATMQTVFPDARVERTAAALERGGHACFPWRLDGTHMGDYGPLPGTEKPLSLHGLHYVELSDGLVRRARGFFDLYEGAVQLGLLPQRGGLGETAMFLLRGFGLRR
jgi:hypothetical protein